MCADVGRTPRSAAGSLAGLSGLLCLLCAPLALAQSPRAQPQPESYQRGVQLARAGKLAEALRELELAAQSYPREPKVHNMLGVVLTQLGRLDEADRAYARALELAPGFLPARKNWAVNLFSRKQYREATREFEGLARLEPKDFVPHLFLGLLAMEDSRLEAARTHLTEAHRLSPPNARVWLPLARVELLTGHRESALEAAAVARKAAGLTDAEQFELGALLAQFGANDEAREIFRDLQRKDRASYEVGFNLALVSYRAGYHQEALQVVEKLLAAGKRSAELLNLRGWICAKLRRPGQARESLEQALALEPRNADHYLDLGTLFMSANDREAALRVLAEGIERVPGDGRLYVAAGLVRQSAGDLLQAERWFRHALEVDEASGSGHLALANLLLESGRREEAFEQLAKGLAVLPNYPLLYYAYGALLLDSAGDGDKSTLAKAKSMLQRAAGLSPYYANSYYLLGRVSMKLEDETEAQTFFEKASKLNPSHVSSLYQLSQIALRRGDRKRAAELAGLVRSLRAEAVMEDRQAFAAALEESLRSANVGQPVLPAAQNPSPPK